VAAKRVPRVVVRPTFYIGPISVCKPVCLGAMLLASEIIRLIAIRRPVRERHPALIFSGVPPNTFLLCVTDANVRYFSIGKSGRKIILFGRCYNGKTGCAVRFAVLVASFLGVIPKGSSGNVFVAALNRRVRRVPRFAPLAVMPGGTFPQFSRQRKVRVVVLGFCLGRGARHMKCRRDRSPRAHVHRRRGRRHVCV